MRAAVSAQGISLVTSSGGPGELAHAARLAQDAGFASVWATEFYDRSATVGLAAMAQATSTIELGSAIAYAFGRTPLVLAAEARDLDELSGGRLALGLGTGTRRMQQDWHGLDGEHPVTVIVCAVWAVTSDRCGWFSGWRRAGPSIPGHRLGLTSTACVARRRPRTFGVT
jgi:hypothetical protein